jgi:hypothetical protein
MGLRDEGRLGIKPKTTLADRSILRKAPSVTYTPKISDISNVPKIAADGYSLARPVSTLDYS